MRNNLDVWVELIQKIFNGTRAKGIYTHHREQNIANAANRCSGAFIAHSAAARSKGRGLRPLQSTALDIAHSHVAKR